MRKAVLIALAVTLLCVAARLWLWTPTGFTRAVFPALGERGTPAIARTHATDLAFMRAPHGPTRFFSARWQGRWLVEDAGAYTLYLGADDWATLSIDGTPVLERSAAVGFSTRSVTRQIDAGLHTIDLRYEQNAGGAFLTAGWSHAGGPMRPFRDAAIFPEPPPDGAPAINRAIRGVAFAALAAWLVVLVMLVGVASAKLRARAAADAHGWRGLAAAAGQALARRERWLSLAALAIILLIATALRLDGIFVQYGPFDRPAWLSELESHTRHRIEAVRPDAFGWQKIDQPYVGGDPVNYIRFAREMQAFSAAHVREPMFSFVTKLWLTPLDGQDVAVSFASTTFSVLAVLATWGLGRYVCGAWVGGLAALGLAIDKDMVTWGADGWRDDAVTFFTVAASLALVRVFDRPSWGWAVVAGVVSAGALLTRVTMLSCLLPGLALLVCFGAGAWRVRAGRAGAVLLVALALAAPYFINCWRVYGDPLYAINYHTRFYRARAGEAYDQPMGVGTYLRQRLRQDPAGTLRTGVVGVTTYPFLMKWTGFDFWWNGMGRVLAWLSAAGLVLLATSRRGAFLLVLLVTSLVPYAFTWQIPGGGEWRFTMHAYPVYLMAAALALAGLVASGARLLSSVPSPKEPS